MSWIFRQVWSTLLWGALVHTAVAVDMIDTSIVQKSLQSGNTSTALQQVDALLEVRPDSPELLFVKARVLVASGTEDAAIGLYEQLIVDHPGMPEPYNNLSVLYAARGDTARAAELLQRALEIHPVYSTIYRNLSQVYADRAIAAYRKALRSDSSEPATPRAPLELSPIRSLTHPGGRNP